jgi:hypothetical protein
MSVALADARCWRAAADCVRLHGWLKTTAVAAQLCIPALVALIAAFVRTPNTRAAHAVLSNLGQRFDGLNHIRLLWRVYMTKCG